MLEFRGRNSCRWRRVWRPMTTTPFTIGYGQTISQPYMTALMAEVLELTGSETRAGSGRRLRIRGGGAGSAGGARDHRGDCPRAGGTGAREPAPHRAAIAMSWWWRATDRCGYRRAGALRRHLGGGGRAGHPRGPAGAVGRSRPPGDSRGRTRRSGTAGGEQARRPHRIAGWRRMCRFVPLRGGEGWQ